MLLQRGRSSAGYRRQPAAHQAPRRPPSVVRAGNLFRTRADLACWRNGRGIAVSMCRLVAVVLVLCGFVAAPAGAATVGVFDGPDLSAVALAGPDVVVLRQTSAAHSELVTVARGGGKPQTVLRVKGMNFVFDDESRRLAGSASRVALIAEIEDARDRTVEWRVYSGPPRGPIAVVRTLPVSEAWVPSLVDVDGDRALIVESRPEPDGPIRAFLFDSVPGLVPIAWARASAAAGRDLGGLCRRGDGGAEPGGGARPGDRHGARHGRVGRP